VIVTHTNAPRIFTPDYYERMRDLESASWWNAGMRDLAARMLDDVALPRTGLLLDVGCGSGQTMQWFARLYPGWRVAGLDLATEGLVAARGLGVTSVLAASALDLPVPSGTVDLVVTLDVVQHLPLDGGDRRALAEVARVLKPGGHLFLRTNAQAFPHTPDDPTFEFHKYAPGELRAKLEQAGLRVLKLGRLNALLGLAEIPRELGARNQRHSYHGLLAEPRVEVAWRARLKRAWLGVEGGAVRRGASLPFGRTIVTVCRKATGA
jgi:SAM-dependent methyltransferase